MERQLYYMQANLFCYALTEEGQFECIIRGLFPKRVLSAQYHKRTGASASFYTG